MAAGKDYRWKGHERKVAAHFGVQRQVFGRGKEGALKTDVVVRLSDYLASTYGIRPNTYERMFVECKYSNGVDSALFKLLTSARKSTPKNIASVTMMDNGRYMMWEIEDTPAVYACLLYSWLEGEYRAQPFDTFGDWAVYHSKKKVPNYLIDFLVQADKDCLAAGGDNIPTVCMGNSSRYKIMILDKRAMSFEELQG